MRDLESTRHEYAVQIGELLWRRYRVRVSHELCSAFARVPREDFLGAAPWLVRGMPAQNVWQRIANLFTRSPRARDWTTDDPTHLYHPDAVVAIDASRGLNNGQPSALAFWIHSLELQPGDRVLHVGCGLGYYTAIMASLVGSGRVVAVEVDAGLASRARANLSLFDAVEVIEGDGGDHDPGPVDAILVNAGVTHPRAVWLESLRLGGRIMVPVTEDSGTGVMLKITREESGYAAQWISSLTIFHCIGSRDPALNRRLRVGFARAGWRAVRSLRRDEHERGTDCWHHGDDFCLSTRTIAQPIHRNRGPA